MKNSFKIFIFITLILSTTKIFATATTTFLVTASVLPACTVAASPLPFGNYVSTADSKVNTTITLTCTPGTTYKVGLNAGATAGATVTTRQMKGTTTPTNLLNYGLYKDAGLTNNWGNVSPDWSTGTAGLTPVVLTVYGKIPAGQNAAVDNYSDTITVTVTYP